MDIAIDRSNPMPVYRQIVKRIRDMILSGSLPTGFQLPPERRLADALGVNRSTILNAYRELKADGLVDSHVGRGTSVLGRPLPEPEAGDARSFTWRQLFRDGAARAQDPLIRDLLSLTERPDIISLSVGLPAPELLPVGAFRDIFNELIDEVGAPLLLHCPTEGHTPFRETLSRWLATRGIYGSASEVLILSGSQQGLDLAARTFIEPGDLVVVEEPTYCGVLPVLRTAQARILGVPTDGNGMRTDLLATLLERHRPKLIYTLPTFQNPSGVVMSLDRRRHLLELAERYQVPILEDDPYSELRYEGEAVPSLKALDRSELVLYLGTFSKVLFPGLRLGYLVAPKPVVRQFTLVKQALDLHSNTPGQWILERYIRGGGYDAHLGLLRKAYSKRRDAMEEALRRHAPSDVSWKRPKGGFYYWCGLPRNVDQTTLLARAADRGVCFLPGSSCYPELDEENHIRLNFSYATEELIHEGMVRLMGVLRSFSGRRHPARHDEAGTPPIV